MSLGLEQEEMSQALDRVQGKGPGSQHMAVCTSLHGHLKVSPNATEGAGCEPTTHQTCSVTQGPSFLGEGNEWAGDGWVPVQ